MWKPTKEADDSAHDLDDLIDAEIRRLKTDYVRGDYKRCMQVELITIKDREGLPAGEFKFDASGAVKALTLIGKHVDVKAFDVTTTPDASENEILERLQRGRSRLSSLPHVADIPSVSFLEPLEVDTLTSEEKLQQRLDHINMNNRERLE